MHILCAIAIRAAKKHTCIPTPRPALSSHHGARRSVTLQDPIDQSVLQRLLGCEEPVALHVPADLILGFAGGIRVDRVYLLAHLDDLARVDLDVRGLTLKPGRG